MRNYFYLCFQSGAETFKHCTIDVPVEDENDENGNESETDDLKRI